MRRLMSSSGTHFTPPARQPGTPLRLLVVARSDKPRVAAALDELRPWLASRVELVGVESDGMNELRQVEADAVLVLGGDGTLLATARRLAGRSIPVMGVNFGRLGFLASFTPEEMKPAIEALVRDELPVSTRTMLDTSVVDAGERCIVTDPDEITRCRRFSAVALNDAVITAGPPFHMIELDLSVGGQGAIRCAGDGVIISTPSGSTAYNLSAGGPIIDPGVDALCVTPICPHSLSFRPIVVSAASTIVIVASSVNDGTTLFCDGQESTKLHTGDRVVVRRSPHEVHLIENPAARHFTSLAEKLHWAATPRYAEGQQ